MIMLKSVLFPIWSFLSCAATRTTIYKKDFTRIMAIIIEIVIVRIIVRLIVILIVINNSNSRFWGGLLHSPSGLSNDNAFTWSQAQGFSVFLARIWTSRLLLFLVNCRFLDASFL